MLTLFIQSDIYKLHSDIRKQMKLKRELLERYRGDSEVAIKSKGVTIETLRLDELFEVEVKTN